MRMDLKVGDTVQHIFFGRYGVITKIGTKYLHVTINLSDQHVKWLPTSVRKVS